MKRDEWLTSTQAARLFGVNPHTVVRWSNEGKLPFAKTMGGHRRYRRSILEKVLLGQTRAIQ